MEPGPHEQRLRIVGRLGGSGYGRIYQARDEGSGAEVAVRLIDASWVSDETLSLFDEVAAKHEILGAGWLVPIRPPTRMSGHWVVPMELAPATSLRTALRRGACPASVTLEVIEQVGRALHAGLSTPDPETGTAVGLFHRNLRPEKVLIAFDGSVRLLGFGVPPADVPEHEDPYAPPERSNGEEAPAGDVYSLGVIVRELLTGVTPREISAPDQLPDFDDDGEDEEGDVATEVVDGATRELVTLAVRMCEAHADRRPTALEVAETCAVVRKIARGPSLREWVSARGAGLSPVSDERAGMLLVPDDDLLDDLLQEATPTEDVATEQRPFPGARQSAEMTPRGVVPVHTALPLDPTEGEDDSSALTPLIIGGAVTAAVLLLLLGVVVAAWILFRPLEPVAPTVPPAAVPIEAAPAPPPPAPPVVAEPEPEPEPAPEPEAAPAPERAPAVATAPAPEPEPEAAPPPKPPPPPAPVTGEVTLAGQGTVTLKGGAGTFSPPGSIPVGTYDVLVTFGGEDPFVTGSVTVTAGQTSTIDCKAMMGRCFIR